MNDPAAERDAGENPGTPRLPRGDGGRILARALAVLIAAVIYALVAHSASAGLDVSRVTVDMPGLPSALDGLRIAQLADLHSSRYGAGQADLVEAIRDFRPDLIAITGDFADGVDPDFEPCLELMRGLGSTAPVYWVRGNHEYYLDKDDRDSFEADMAKLGATLLDNQAAILERNGQKYIVAGMNDLWARHGDLREEAPGMREIVGMENTVDYMEELNRNTPAGDFTFKLMLCHSPSYWQPWREFGYDLALCGHLHGWMVRMPIIGGILRQPSRFFPEEDAGLYDKEGMLVYISRGLGNRVSYRNFRMNNKPELALIEITR